MQIFGLFPLITKLGEVAYKLKLLEPARIHYVFHVYQLKPFEGNSIGQYLPLPMTMSYSGHIMQPAKLLQGRVVQQRNNSNASGVDLVGKYTCIRGSMRVYASWLYPF